MPPSLDPAQPRVQPAQARGRRAGFSPRLPLPSCGPAGGARGCPGGTGSAGLPGMRLRSRCHLSPGGQGPREGQSAGWKVHRWGWVRSSSASASDGLGDGLELEPSCPREMWDQRTTEDC